MRKRPVESLHRVRTLIINTWKDDNVVRKNARMPWDAGAYMRQLMDQKLTLRDPGRGHTTH
jgi:hypothetical protein